MLGCHHMLKTSAIVVALLSATAAAAAEAQRMPENARFCPSWAEAHERTLASLNNGRPPYRVHWKGCVLLKKGAQVDVVGSDDEGHLSFCVHLMRMDELSP